MVITRIPQKTLKPINMKKTTIMFVCVLISVTTHAQVRVPWKNQLSASYGFITTTQILDAFVGISLSVGSLGTVNYNADKYTGGLYLTYRRSSENNKFGYGIAVGYDGISGTFKTPSGSKAGTYKSSSTTAGAECMLAYMNKENVRLYGFLGAGYSFYNYKFTTTSGGSENENATLNHFNFQVTPIGAAFGKNFGGFVELGLGYKGLVNIGLFARL
jgi:hypothetical protein